ncbi:MAG: efflux RND transporter permease subunit, partial [Bacteroidota bacterium]
DGEERPARSRQFKLGAAAVIAFFGLVVFLANWKTFVFLAVTIPVLYYLHKYLLGPFSQRFQTQTVPRLTARYRTFLGWMLDRDYSVNRAMLRNTLALGSFTLGFLLLIGGALIGGVSQPASMLLFVPGIALLVIGILGIVVHAVETVMLGRMGSVKAGLVFGAIVGTLCVLLWMGGRIDNPLLIAELMALPAAIVVFGLLGALVLGQRTRLLLTDNRARLLTATLATLVVIMGLFVLAPTGTEFFPESDPNFIEVNVEAPLGTNIEASNAIAQETYERIQGVLAENDASEENVKTILTRVGIGGDVLFGGGSASPENSAITMTMKDFADRAESSTLTLRKIREQLSGIPGTTFEVVKDENGPPTGKPVNIEVAGEDFDQIVAVSQAIKQRLVRGATEPDPETGTPPLEGLVDIADDLDTGRPQFQVDIDRERAGQFGLSTRQISQTIQAAINGFESSTFRAGEDEYDIVVRLREEDRESLETLRSLTILYEGQQIPLLAVASISTGTGLGNITRLDQERVVTVDGNAAEGVNGNALLATVQGYLADYIDNEVPPGVTIRYTGESEDQAESFGFLTTALLIGLALITLILLLQFNSVGNTLIIMIATGLSLIGVMLGLILTRTPFGLMTFIGVISLAGIVVNNAIVLIDYIEQLRHKQGKEKQEAVIEGGATRLRPVLLTAMTTVIGLVPLTFGLNIDFVGLITNLDPAFQFGSENTQFWGPMGTAIISGLTFATFLTLVIVPVMYSTFDSIATRFSTSSDEATNTTLHTDGTFVPAPAGLRPTEGDGAGNGTVVRPTPSTS